MFIINKIKFLLAKIRLAQINYKKILKIRLGYWELIIVKLLWKNGFIYGYNKLGDFYFIFLKYKISGIGILNELIFYNRFISKKQLNLLLSLEKNSYYFIFTKRGCKLYSKKNNLILLGGVLIARL